MPRDAANGPTSPIGSTSRPQTLVATPDTESAATAGQLALAIGALALAADTPDTLARELVALFTRTFTLAAATWFWQDGHAGRGSQPSTATTPTLRRTRRLPATLPKPLAAPVRAAAEAAVLGRQPVQRQATLAREDGSTQPLHLLACPIGPDEAPAAVLVLAAPLDGQPAPPHIAAALTQLRSTLALALQAVMPATSPPPATITATASATAAETAAETATATTTAAASGLQPADYLTLLSHDIRTPLHTLGGFLEMVHDEMAGPLNERQMEFIGHARAGATTLATMIDDVLILSRADAGLFTLKRVPVAVPPLIEGLLHTLRDEARSWHVQLIADLPQRLPQVSADADRITDALRRVVLFAVRRSPQHGTVRIALEEDDNAAIHITVTDAGTPIRRAQRERLFRLPAGREGTHASHDDVHLDLTVARMILELHGGTITVAHSTEAETALLATLPSSV